MSLLLLQSMEWLVNKSNTNTGSKRTPTSVKASEFQKVKDQNVIISSNLAGYRNLVRNKNYRLSQILYVTDENGNSNELPVLSLKSIHKKMFPDELQGSHKCNKKCKCINNKCICFRYKSVCGSGYPCNGNCSHSKEILSKHTKKMLQT